MIRRECLRL